MISVRRSKWSNSLLPLVCGISNAGGGTLLIDAESKNKGIQFKKMQKPLEAIPAAIRKNLGLHCSIEPIMEDMQLCLEISIPASTEPIKLSNKYYLFVDGQNIEVDRSRITADSSTAQPAQGANTDAAKPKISERESATKNKSTKFADKSIAAAKDIYLTQTDEYVLKILGTNGRATAPKMAEVLGVSESTIRRSFKRLKDEGMIERVGSKKAGYWKVIL